MHLGVTGAVCMGTCTVVGKPHPHCHLRGPQGSSQVMLLLMCLHVHSVPPVKRILVKEEEEITMNTGVSKTEDGRRQSGTAPGCGQSSRKQGGPDSTKGTQYLKPLKLDESP